MGPEDAEAGSRTQGPAPLTREAVWDRVALCVVWRARVAKTEPHISVRTAHHHPHQAGERQSEPRPEHE